MDSDSLMPSKVAITVDTDPEAPLSYSETSPGDMTLSFTLPSAEYMYGCGATATGMLIGYYDLYGYYENGVRYRLNALIPGTISVDSRGSDGGSIYDMKDPSKLANFIASAGYIKRFYDKTPSQELSYSYLYGNVNSGLNTGAWDCLADYLGTGQYWRGNDDLSTRHYNDVTLEDLLKYTSWTYTIDGKNIPSKYIDFKYGLSLYVQSVGYELDAKKTRTATKENFSFDDFRKEIDADRPVLLHLVSGSSGHIVTAYGYNSSTKEIIFDDTYRSNCRMYWDGTYKYSGKYYEIKAISTVAFVTSSLTPLRSEVLSVKADITKLTNRNVTVSATFNEDTVTGQYSLDQSQWYTYKGSVTVTQNGKVYFRGLALGGAPSAVVTYSVTNIDKTAPEKPVASASTTSPTNQDVTVTAQYSSDSAVKQYSRDGSQWLDYGGGVVLSQNGTLYFRAADAAGNVSGITKYSVTNIDKKAPAAPMVKASTAALTNQNVTVTAAFSLDSAKKQYSLDNEAWQNYSGALTATENASYYFRAIDAAGNISNVTEYTVTNIDKTAPDAPTVKAGTTAMTNKDVTVTATFSKDSAQKQYSTDDKTWKTYSKVLTATKNATYYFRGIDAAGNVSSVAVYEVANIDKAPPAKPAVKASTTKATNQDVTITATFAEDCAKKQYSADNKTWKTYTAALTAAKNATYYFRGIDAAGNASQVASIKVTNIDKTAPAKPTVKASTTAATNKNVTITATFSKDSAQKQYSLDNATWSTYSKALSVGENGTYYFRGTDAAGNVSKVASIKVANIDKTPPAAPAVKANITTPTNKNVTVTASFSKDSAKKQYSTDKKTWSNYSKALMATKNATYYFRAVDAAGNISKLTAFKVANIDKTAPAAPKLKASTTKATNKNVTITATFAEDCAKKQYSADNKTWKTYTAALSVAKNGTYYFRGIDAAGNVSKAASIKVANIDKTAPAAPTVTVSTAKSTNKSVTVTATFSKDSAQKQYTLDGETWKNYTKPLALKNNALVSFRGIDAAGNVSKLKTVAVDNIMDTGNNKWENATALTGDTFAAVDKSFDKIDCYDIDDVSRLGIYMRRGKIRVTLCDADGKPVECTMYDGDGGEICASSFEIALDSDPDRNSRCFDAIADEVKFLKIEAAATGISSYHLTPGLA